MKCPQITKKELAIDNQNGNVLHVKPIDQYLEMARPTARFDIEWPTGLTVRRPQESDIEAMTRLDLEDITEHDLATLPFPDSIQRFFDYIPQNANQELSLRASCVVLADNAIVAYCLFVADHSDEAHLYNIHVVRSHRRQGLATRMIQQGITTLSDNYPGVNLDVEEKGDPSYLLYEKLGFEERTK